MEETKCNELLNSPSFSSIKRFFEKQENFDLAEQVLAKKKRVSLRVLEYVAANNSKFIFNVSNHGKFRDILDSKGKKSFDVRKLLTIVSPNISFANL